MANSYPSTNMGLPIPVVGVDPGPDWANNFNTCLTILDGHTHLPGSGVAITPQAININSDLTFGGYNATNLKTTRFSVQGSPITASSPNLFCLYTAGVDLYYNDGGGNQIQMTSMGGVAGASGSISGLTLPASATYVAVSGKFVWQSAANTAATMDQGTTIIRDISTANGNGVTLQTASGLASNVSLTLPSALPGSNSFLTLTTAGVLGTASSISAAQIANASITGSQIANTTITATQIANATITTTQISATAGITGSQIANTTIAAGNIVSGTITGTQLANNINLPGTNSKAAGLTIAVARSSAFGSQMAILGGSVSSSGTVVGGVGFTPSRSGVGSYTVTYTTNFASSPAAVAVTVVAPASPAAWLIGTMDNSHFTLLVKDLSGSAQDSGFSFVVVGDI